MGLGPTEIILVILVIVLLFGAKKLPELARGSGRALRIFKAETKGLLDDDDDEKTKTEEQQQIDAQRAETIRYEQPSTSTTDPVVDHPAALRRGLTPPLPKLTGLVRMFSVRPASPVGADGKMALADHLREVRGRLLRVVVVLFVLMVVMLFLYDHLLDIVLAPYNDAKEQLGDSVETKAYIKGAAGPLLLQLKLSGIAALVVGQPLLALPDLGVHPPGAAPAASASGRGCSPPSPARCSSPGSRSATTCCPRGLEVLIGFTPAELENLVEFGEYFSLLHPHAAGLRRLLRDPAVRDHAEPRGRGVRQDPGGAPRLDHHRRLRLRGRRHAVDRCGCSVSGRTRPCAGRASRCSRWDFPQTPWTATRASSPAASGSGSRSPARWSATRRSSSSTSR